MCVFTLTSFQVPSRTTNVQPPLPSAPLPLLLLPAAAIPPSLALLVVAAAAAAAALPTPSLLAVVASLLGKRISAFGSVSNKWNRLCKIAPVP